MEINLISGALGAEIKGIDLKDSSEKNWKIINDLLLEHKVLFLEIKILQQSNRLILLRTLDPLKNMFM